MKTFKFLSIIALLAIGFTSCSDDDGPNLVPIESEQVSNLFAPTTSINGPMGPTPDGGVFTKFSFQTGQVTSSDTDWDIAFRSTAVIINGGVSSGAAEEPARNGNAGVYFIDETFRDVTSVDTSLFEQDSQSGYAIIRQSDQGWYNYSGFVTNLITPVPGRTFVFRTRDGRFAKVQFISYYEGAPTSPDSTVDNARYYTFNYIYQPNEGVTTFE